MVVICQPLLLPKAHKKQSNQRLCKNSLLIQSLCSIIVNLSPSFPQSTDIRTICREFEHVVKYVAFGFPTKNHPQTLVLKLEKHRKTIGPNG